MKCGIVKASDIRRAPWLRLDAEYYLDPTAEVDRKIATLTKRIGEDGLALARRVGERNKILDEKVAIPIEVKKPCK
jgi:hypothetical protein